MNTAKCLLLVLTTGMFSGCMALEPVVWQKAEPLDLTRGSVVTVDANCLVPSADLEYLKQDIQQKLDFVFTGNNEAPNAYAVHVTITRYDEGNRFVRYLLPLTGLGQMHLYCTVKISEGEPPVSVREGEVRKYFYADGTTGLIVSMQTHILPLVGPAIVDAVRAPRSETNVAPANSSR